MGKMIYLAGPITGVGDSARGWRANAIQMLEAYGFKAIDPLVVEAATITPSAVVELDYAWISKSSGIIARVDTPSWGTAMELVYAYNKGIPVVAWGDVSHVSPWLLFHTSIIKPTLTEAVDHLKEILQ